MRRLRIASPEGAAPRVLQTADLRRLGMTGIVEAAYDKLRDELSEAAAQELATRRPAPSSQSEYRQQLLEQRRRQEALRAAGPKRAGRPRLSVDQLEEVAEVYAQAFAEQRPPRKAVAAYFKISPTAAASRIARARQAGLLGLSGRGRAGAGRSDPWQRCRRAGAPDPHQGVHGAARRRGCTEAAGWWP